MWECPECGESIDDGFEACWQCGCGHDGTRNPGFQPEPQDPDVPDPGSGSEEEVVEEPKQEPGIVEVYAAANIPEAYFLKNRLEEAGIDAKVVGDELNAVAGGAPFGYLAAPRIWVDKEDAARTQEIIRV